MNARSATVRIMYNGKNIVKDISDYVQSFSFTDNAAGKLDDMTLRLEDSGGLFMKKWFPGKGAKVKAYIDTHNWRDDGKTVSLFCGVFRLDEVEYSVNPDNISLKGISVPFSSGIKQTKKTRSWDNVTLKDVALQIATANGLGFSWQSNITLPAGRYDQRDESDLTFMRRSLDVYGHDIKLTEDKLVVYHEKYLKNKTPAVTFTKTSVERAYFRSKTHNTYTKCHISYHDPKKKTVHNHIATDPDVKSGQTLRLHRRATSKADAQRQAEAALSKKNKFQVTATIDCIGNPYMRATYKANLTGFGVFDGTYFIDKITHTLEDGYRCAVEVHKA